MLDAADHSDQCLVDRLGDDDRNGCVIDGFALDHVDLGAATKLGGDTRLRDGVVAVDVDSESIGHENLPFAMGCTIACKMGQRPRCGVVAQEHDRSTPVVIRAIA